jgi:hypothetical protein
MSECHCQNKIAWCFKVQNESVSICNEETSYWKVEIEFGMSDEQRVY